MIKKVAVLTSGGDAPGMNSAVRAVIKEAKLKGIEPYIVYGGYHGLVENKIIHSNEVSLDFFNSLGGTCIFSTRYDDFKENGVIEQAAQNLKNRGIEALVVIGGDGSYKGAQNLANFDIKTVSIPGTIDNDIPWTDFSIGFDTALNTAVKAIDAIRDTANSHRRIMIVEVMGNKCGDLALFSGLATGAEIISTSECPIPEDKLIEMAKKISLEKKPTLWNNICIVVSEHLYNVYELAKKIEKVTNRATRASILSYIQRGGAPTAWERAHATMFGMKAIQALANGESNVAISLTNNQFITIPIADVLKPNYNRKKESKRWAVEFNKMNSIID